jgi:hypothetical protein
MKRLFTTAAMAVFLVLANSTSAERLVFTAPSGYFPPYTGSLSWPALNGFAMGPFWGSNNGRDLRNAPYIPGNLASLTSTFGEFTFNSMELGGWPWDDFGITGPDTNNPIPLTFYGPGLQLLTQRLVTLPGDNTFVLFSERIEGVQALAIGASTFSSINVRLGALTLNESLDNPLPEPSSLLLFMTSMALVQVTSGVRRNGP